MEITKENVLAALQNLVWRDHGKDVKVADQIIRLDVQAPKAYLDLEIGSPALHSKRSLESQVKKELQEVFGDTLDLSVHIVVNVVSGRRDEKKLMPGVRNIIAVASGKGGVGKSTVAANLAVALAKMGAKVAIVDADIYGPSVPIMFDTQFVRPAVKEVDGKTLIVPVENYGIKMLSIGFFADIDQAVVWRGPMASKALSQMFIDADWGDVDFMFIDLPPGTGDIHLTLVQSVPVTGAVIVSTPQDVALADARKGVGMFKLPNINVPVLGLVENMAWFTPAELPENKYYIFGKDGVKNLAEELKVPLLGQIPLIQSIRESGDIGTPVALDDSHPAQKYFMELAEKMMERVQELRET